MTQHAALGASSAERWMTCPGSIRLSEGIEQPDSAHAAEGTVAHTLAEKCLENDGLLLAPEDYIGEAPDPDYPDILCDQEMADAVQVYLDHVNEVRDLPTFSGEEIEKRVNLNDVWKALKLRKDRRPAGQMFGTADYTAVAGPRLHVVDYKHGRGVVVEAEENPQLRYYALGQLFSLQPDVRERIHQVVVTVVQPRAEHPDGPVRSETLDVSNLVMWGKKQLAPAAKATEDPDAPLHAGPHCRFCPAAGICPEQRKVQLEKARFVFRDEDGRLEPETEPEDLSVEEIKAVLDAMPEIQQWLRRVQERAHAMVENQELSAGQKERLGYKLVAKRAQRKWAQDEETTADRLCELFGLGDEELFEWKLRSPAQVEKEIGKAAVKDNEDWDELVTSQSSGTTLAPVDDPRPSVEPKTAADAFGGDS